jgi:hypothetical protein
MWTESPEHRKLKTNPSLMMPLTTSRIQTSTAAVAFEMLRFLMRDEDFEIIEVTLAVIAPRPTKDLLNVRVTSLFTHLGHLG